MKTDLEKANTLTKREKYKRFEMEWNRTHKISKCPSYKSWLEFYQ